MTASPPDDLAALLARHVVKYDQTQQCWGCGQRWPCDTRRFADALAAAAERARQERELADRLARAYEAVLRVLDIRAPLPPSMESRVEGSALLREHRAAREAASEATG